MGATPRQLALIDTLVQKLELTGELKDRVYAVAAEPSARPSVEISQLIDGLIERRKARNSASPQAAPGYYVRVDGEAIVVVENREKTRTYGKRFISRSGMRPEWRYEPGLGLSVAELEPMTAEDAARIGLSHGYCIRCCAELGGDGLSARISAVIGYGETCARRMGWPYPSGVAAQRRALASGGATW